MIDNERCRVTSTYIDSIKRDRQSQTITRAHSNNDGLTRRDRVNNTDNLSNDDVLREIEGEEKPRQFDNRETR